MTPFSIAFMIFVFLFFVGGFALLAGKMGNADD